MNEISPRGSRRRGVVLLVLIGVCAMVIPYAVAAQMGGADPPVRSPVSGHLADDPGIAEAVSGETVPEEWVLAQPPTILNYQGYLTNGAGSPLSTRVHMQASLWDASDGGALQWGPENHADVLVTEGLFHLPLGSRLALTPGLFSQALYLQVQVDGTVLPRQPLRPSPYAFSVLPGAMIMGSPPIGSEGYALRVVNNGAQEGMRGLLAIGQEYGLVADSLSANGAGVYTPDFVQARGYKSSDDSYVFIPGNAGVGWVDRWYNDLTVRPMSSGAIELERNAGTDELYIPLTIPVVLFGQNVTVEELQFQYQVSNPAIAITEVSLDRGTGIDTTESLLLSVDELRSTTPATVTLTPANVVLGADQGPLQVRFALSFSAKGVVHIAWVRLRLGHS